MITIILKNNHSVCVFFFENSLRGNEQASSLTKLFDKDYHNAVYTSKQVIGQVDLVGNVQIYNLYKDVYNLYF